MQQSPFLTEAFLSKHISHHPSKQTNKFHALKPSKREKKKYHTHTHSLSLFHSRIYTSIQKCAPQPTSSQPRPPCPPLPASAAVSTYTLEASEGGLFSSPPAAASTRDGQHLAPAAAPTPLRPNGLVLVHVRADRAGTNGGNVGNPSTPAAGRPASTSSSAAGQPSLLPRSAWGVAVPMAATLCWMARTRLFPPWTMATRSWGYSCGRVVEVEALAR